MDYLEKKRAHQSQKQQQRGQFLDTCMKLQSSYKCALKLAVHYIHKTTVQAISNDQKIALLKELTSYLRNDLQELMRQSVQAVSYVNLQCGHSVQFQEFRLRNLTRLNLDPTLSRVEELRSFRETRALLRCPNRDCFIPVKEDDLVQFYGFEVYSRVSKILENKSVKKAQFSKKCGMCLQSSQSLEARCEERHALCRDCRLEFMNQSKQAGQVFYCPYENCKKKGMQLSQEFLEESSRIILQKKMAMERGQNSSSTPSTKSSQKEQSEKVEKEETSEESKEGELLSSSESSTEDSQLGRRRCMKCGESVLIQQIVSAEFLKDCGHRCQEGCDSCKYCWIKCVNEGRKTCLNCLAGLGERIKTMKQKLCFQ